MKILVVTKNWLGDILFQIPAFEVLRKKYPAAEIICMSPARCQEILEAHPAVNRVLIFDEKKEHRSWAKRLAFVFKLRQERFDCAYLLHGSRTRAALLWLAGIPSRTGFEENRIGFLTRAIKKPKLPLHQVDYFLYLIEQSENVPHEFHPYHFYFSEKDAASAKSKLKNLSASPYLCFHLGANWELKRWPVTHFAKLADLIHQKWGMPIVVTGGAQDRSLAEELKKQVHHASLMIFTGQTTLGELGAIFKESTLVISGDSGPMHIASGVGAPVIALFGPTDPDWTGPRGTGKVILLRYIPQGFEVPWIGEEKDFPNEGWMSRIRPEQVMDAIEKEGIVLSHRA